MAVIFSYTEFTNGTLWNEWLPADSTLFPPLTTLFEPPTGCSTEWIQNPLATNEVRSGAHDFYVPGSSAASDFRINYDDPFLPTDYFARCRPSKHPMTLGYSPGICTSGQTMAAVVERRYLGSTYWMGSCCNSDMTISLVNGVCTKVFSTPMTVLANLTTTWTRGSTTVTASAVDLTTYACTGTRDENDWADTTLRRLTEVTSGTVFAAQFVVYWQSSDFSRFPSEYASSLAAAIKVPFEDPATTSPSTTSTNFVPPFTNPNNEDPDAAMSPDAIAGIAVGIGAFLISSIVLLLYLRRRMKQKQQQRLQHSDMWEMEGSSRGLKHFLGGRWRAEQDGTSQPVEAGSTSVRIIPGPLVELDTTPAERTQ